MATKKIKRFQEGGMSDKDRGLEASKDDKVGFFERLRMGNIDEEGSEAYNRFGAGRAKADRDIESEAAAMRAVDKSRASTAAPAAPVAPAAMPERDAMEEANAREPIPVPAGPRADQPRPGNKPRVNVQAEKTSAPAKSSPKMQEQTYRRTSGDTGVRPAKNPNYSNEGRGRELTKRQQVEQEIDSIKPTAEQTQKGLETAATMMGAPGLKALQATAKKLAGSSKGASSARSPAQQAYDRAQMAERLTVARNAPVSTAAKTTAVGKKTSDYRSLAGSAREDAKANQAYDKLKKLSSRGAGKASSNKTKKFDDESNIEFKRGGSVSSASKRGDGIATRGKTNCKMR
jgi:hypothetical protein